MRVQLREPNDMMLSDDGTEMLLLYDRTVIRLGTLASAIVELSVQPITFDDLNDALVAHFGPPPPEGSGQARHQVEELIAQGVLLQMS